MLRTSALVASLACLLPGLAAAEPTAPDYARSGAYLGVGGTYAFHWFPGSFDDDFGGSGATVRTDGTGGLNTRFGYRVNSWFAAELEYEWLDGFDNKVETPPGGGSASLGSHAITANGKFLYPGWGRFQPYGLVGVGASIWTTSGNTGVGLSLAGNGAGVAGRVGAGLDTYITESWLVNVGIEAVFTSTQIDNASPSRGDLKNLFYIPIQFGLQYRF